MCWSSSNGYHQKPLLEQELPTLPEHLSSPIVFSWICVAQNLLSVWCFEDHCIVCFSSIYVIGGVMVSMLTSSAGFEPRSG
jgi:hypothetical protein